jgi:hypothetical protein
MKCSALCHHGIHRIVSYLAASEFAMYAAIHILWYMFGIGYTQYMLEVHG